MKKFSETRIGEFCKGLLDYGEGYGLGLLGTTKMLYLFPTFIREVDENKEIARKLSEKGIQPVNNRSDSFNQGLAEGVTTGVLLDIGQALFYIGALATDNWEYTTPLFAFNLASGVCEVRRELKKSYHDRVNEKVDAICGKPKTKSLPPVLNIKGNGFCERELKGGNYRMFYLCDCEGNTATVYTKKIWHGIEQTVETKPLHVIVTDAVKSKNQLSKYEEGRIKDDVNTLLKSYMIEESVCGEDGFCWTEFGIPSEKFDDGKYLTKFLDDLNGRLTKYNVKVPLNLESSYFQD